MNTASCSVLELRQYTLHPGTREVLIELFERELIETQEEVGCHVLGHFRDLDRPDRFVWLRGFRDMKARREALAAFYGGPAWSAHREAANATMIDSDDVLLLRPAGDPGSFAPPTRALPALGSPVRPGAVLASLYFLEHAVGARDRQRLAACIAPAIQGGAARLLGVLETEGARNDFPRLPVRTGEHVLVAFAAVPSAAALAAVENRLVLAERHAGPFMDELARPPQRLRLQPAARSLLP